MLEFGLHTDSVVFVTAKVMNFEQITTDDYENNLT